MKRLKSIETEEVALEIIECDCGFHLGIDATWLDASQNSTGFKMNCPSCNTVIEVDELTSDLNTEITI